MAHDCPECDLRCHCQGDIDDLVFNGTREQLLCKCCEGKEDEDPWEWEPDTMTEVGWRSRNEPDLFENEYGFIRPQPTHWMPLPTPPSVQEGV